MSHFPKILAVLGLAAGAALAASACATSGAPDDPAVEEGADQASPVTASSEENTSVAEAALQKRFFFNDPCQRYWRCLDPEDYFFCPRRFPIGGECDEYDRRFGYGEYG